MRGSGDEEGWWGGVATVFDGKRWRRASIVALAVVVVGWVASFVLVLAMDGEPQVNVGAAIAAAPTIPVLVLFRCLRRSTEGNARAVGTWNGYLQQVTTISLAVYFGLLLAGIIEDPKHTATVAGILLILQPVGSFFAGQRSAMTRAETEATLTSMRDIQVSTQQTIQSVALIQRRSEDALASIRALQVRALSGPLALELLMIQGAHDEEEGRRSLQRLVWLAGSSVLTDTRLCSCSLWNRVSDAHLTFAGAWTLVAASVARPGDKAFRLPAVPDGEEHEGAGILPNLYAARKRPEQSWSAGAVRAWRSADVFLAGAKVSEHPWFRPRPDIVDRDRAIGSGAPESMAVRLLRDPFNPEFVVGALVLTSPAAEVVPIADGPERDEMMAILDHWSHTFYWAFFHYFALPSGEAPDHG